MVKLRQNLFIFSSNPADQNLLSQKGRPNLRRFASANRTTRRRVKFFFISPLLPRDKQNEQLHKR